MVKKFKNYGIYQYSKEERKKLKNQLNQMKYSLQRQNDKYYELFLKPNNDLIEAIDNFCVNHPSKKHNQIGIIQLKKIMKKRQEYSEKIKEILK